jgi:hypothetical protein
MKFRKSVFLSLVFVAGLWNSQAQDKKFKVHTIAFYNVENLFDTIDQANYDEEYLPKNGWTTKKYKKKLNNLSRVIAGIGTNDQQKDAPTILGVCEVENKGVLEDLVKNPQLLAKDYGVVHFDSPDKRGIDVGLIYQKKFFKPTSFINVPLYVYRDKADTAKKEEKDKDSDETDKIVADATSKRVYTRDQLLVTGLLEGEEVHFIVNHWPSRSGGEKRSSPYREAAGRLNRKIMDSLFKINPNAKIITMGDLNDGTYNKSVKEGIGAKLKKTEVKKFGIYNPFEQMANEGNATLFYRDSGDIFDQMMMSEALIRNDFTGWQYWKAGIYNKQYLIQTTGQYKGYPLRNSNSEPGFSDHFAVYVYLIKEVK